MAIQLKNRLDTNVGATVSIVTVLEGLSLAEIAERIVDQLETGRRGGDGHHGGRDGTGHRRTMPLVRMVTRSLPGRSSPPRRTSSWVSRRRISTR